MPRSLPIFVFALALTCILGPSPVAAGNNAGGTVRLSWDDDGLTSTRSVPPFTPFPLFLHIDGAPDILEFAIELRWLPFDSTGQCYSIVPASSDTACGWSTAIPPVGGFEGDSSYTWSILFPPFGADRSCVIYWVSMATCDSAPPAKFYIADARVKDSNGAIDTLQNVGDSKLLGGPLPDSLSGPPGISSGRTANRTGLTLSAVPNPGSSEMILRFTLPAGVPHSLGIYDVSGRLVLRVPDTHVTGGSGSFRWNLANMQGLPVGPGMYFARLVSQVGTRVTALTVLK